MCLLPECVPFSQSSEGASYPGTGVMDVSHHVGAWNQTQVCPVQEQMLSTKEPSCQLIEV